jgi:hypothetical protein
MFLCFCVPLQKNKNVRDAFASVTGRRRALPPPGSAAALASLARVLEHPADHCTQRVTCTPRITCTHWHCAHWVQ